MDRFSDWTGNACFYYIVFCWVMVELTIWIHVFLSYVEYLGQVVLIDWWWSTSFCFFVGTIVFNCFTILWIWSMYYGNPRKGFPFRAIRSVEWDFLSLSYLDFYYYLLYYNIYYNSIVILFCYSEKGLQEKELCTETLTSLRDIWICSSLCRYHKMTFL